MFRDRQRNPSAFSIHQPGFSYPDFLTRRSPRRWPLRNPRDTGIRLFFPPPPPPPVPLDPDAIKILRRLKRFGHDAYMVGGCVRDLLLGSIPKDFDVSTSARPRQIRRIFKNSKIIGRRFKLVHIMFGGKIIEVSTFRKAPTPETNAFKSDGLLILRDNVYGDERDDAIRRDFTVNSLFYDMETEEVIDYTGGLPGRQATHLANHRRSRNPVSRRSRTHPACDPVFVTLVHESRASAVRDHEAACSKHFVERLAAGD